MWFAWCERLTCRRERTMYDLSFYFFNSRSFFHCFIISFALVSIIMTTSIWLRLQRLAKWRTPTSVTISTEHSRSQTTELFGREGPKRQQVATWNSMLFVFWRSLAYVPGRRTDPPSGGQSCIRVMCESCESQPWKHDCCHIEEGIQKLRSTVFWLSLRCTIVVWEQKSTSRKGLEQWPTLH